MDIQERWDKARKGTEIRGVVRRPDGKPPEDCSLTVYWPDGSEVSAGFSWEPARGKFDSRLLRELNDTKEAVEKAKREAGNR